MYNCIKKSNTSTVRTLNFSTISMAHNKHWFFRSTAELKILVSSNRPIFTLSCCRDRIIYTRKDIFRLPQRIISDNGPPFKSRRISTYIKNSRITHNRITPLHPRANGIVENFMRNHNKMLCVANMQQRNWKSPLYNYLLTYRVSLNMSTKVQPALLLKNKISENKNSNNQLRNWQ